jgi:hypothetical protein
MRPEGLGPYNCKNCCTISNIMIWWPTSGGVKREGGSWAGTENDTIIIFRSICHCSSNSVSSSLIGLVTISQSVRFEVSTAVTTKNAIFWDVTLCGSCKN